MHLSFFLSSFPHSGSPVTPAACLCMRLTVTSSIFLLWLCSAIFCSAKRKWRIYQDCEDSKRGSMGSWKSVKVLMQICTSYFCTKREESQQRAHVAINILQIGLKEKGFAWLSFDGLKRSRAISCNLSPSHSLSLLTSLDLMMLLLVYAPHWS